MKTKIYPDLTGFWWFSWPQLLSIDTTNNQTKFEFYPYPEYSDGVGFYIDKINDSNTSFLVRGFYTDSSGVNGTFFRRDYVNINLSTDSMSFPIYTSVYGNKMGLFTCKYNKQNGKLIGNFKTWYWIRYNRNFGKEFYFTHQKVVATQ